MKFKKGSKETSQRAQSILDEFNAKRRAYSNKDWERALDKLNLALCQDSPDVKSHTLEHTEIQDILPFYVTDEQMRSDVQSIYPLVWQHLQTCSTCLEIYEMLATPPQAEVKSHAERGPGATANVPAHPELAAWNKTERARTGTFTFTFSPNYIRTLGAPSASLPLRGATTAAKKLLISDSISHQAQPIYFTAWLEPSERRGIPDQIRLEITVPRSVALVAAILWWNGKKHTPLKLGRDLLFQNLALPRVNDASSEKFALELNIVAKKHNPTLA